MINCKRAEDFMSDYLEGLLVEKKRKTMENHLQDCSRCASICENMQRTIHVLGTVAEIAPSPSFERTLREKLQEDRDRSDRTVWKWFPSITLYRPRPAFTFSLILIFIGLGVFFFRDSLFQKEQALFVASDGMQTRIERDSASTETTHVDSSVRLLQIYR